jgi:hypothetical protein
MHSVTDAPAIVPHRDPETDAREWFTAQLRASVDIAAICRILNGVTRRANGLPPCEVTDLPLKDGRRLFAIAKATVRSLDPDVQVYAVDEVAHVICEGGEEEYEKLENQSPRLQARYRRWAVTAINAYVAALEGR